MTNWISHKKTTNHPVISSGSEFLYLTKDLIEKLPEYLKDKEAEIFRRRISIDYSQQDTLQELGDKFGVSRERIRQIEKKLLRQLSASFFNNKMIKTSHELIINPNYNQWWQLAAEEYRENEIIDLEIFIRNLSDRWNVSENKIILYISFIINIFTQNTTSILNKDASSNNHISQAALINTDEKTKNIKLNKLRFKHHKYITKLNTIGVNKIKDIHKVWPLEKSKASKSIETHLYEIQEAALSQNNIDWLKYKNLLNLNIMPSITPNNDEHFLVSLERSIDEILSTLPLSKRAPASNNNYKWNTQLDRIRIIFKNRVALPRTKRKTLSDVSFIIYGADHNGPSVARDEKIYLKMLNSAIVKKQYMLLSCWLKEEFCEYIEKFNHIFKKSNNDYDRFIELIKIESKKQNIDPLVGIPILWSLFYGHPPDRYFHLKKESFKKLVDDPNKNIITTKIKLTGFRKNY